MNVTPTHSTHADFLIMDSNFRTSTGALMDPRKLRLYIAAAHAYGTCNSLTPGPRGRSPRIP